MSGPEDKLRAPEAVVESDAPAVPADAAATTDRPSGSESGSAASWAATSGDGASAPPV